MCQASLCLAYQGTVLSSLLQEEAHDGPSVLPLQASGHEQWQSRWAHLQAEREKREEERIRATHQLEKKQVCKFQCPKIPHRRLQLPLTLFDLVAPLKA